MSHPAEIAAGSMEKQGGFWAVLPWLLMAAPFATQLIDRFRGGATGDPLKQLQVPGFNAHTGFGRAAKSYAAHAAPDYVRPTLSRVASGLQRYRSGIA